ncbi:UDP-glucose 4-epimerase [Toxoplasma gondii TgCatPRC2]|uniref:UDP-glucose 4-epimerase n=11 Tax=Toxoplasma gondii TaxID=5811 RepID=S7UWL1_TOXGG|nr:UDP-glucose 4-epimerase [Toxoplasma gondii ME49]EPR62191.1 UDP-glucose 4-epimerase [Toxoplasma gondii GT1]KAF4640625.1 UDP-glucose 4-epimerase [Toxoplasma gondii]KFG42794.1 UDP-glucose 4-epimerase [Toxoplasma gondii p89]KFG45430.1 UDP-glucose 4-epimerase [Toxoplasma gondii GAB2-2007-GAL-DOM2]KFG55111.1 UDP-glucose 4-epimerase [Toxoplasma gondii FOU]KFH13990.1 UDP-glucose 4-epimerase [Toxoplasma gondii MAS]KYK71938.1 UDP-glucose 4-epimerase [Toxoplasma gondii TgCatPRC2]PIM04026.1 UDP-gluc|eukprot:XP_002366251.1 UDP-glucose 4-epimerase [Toxoplasma gondii ME49]
MPTNGAAKPVRVLCTGGLGYIGSHTVVRLVEAGFDVTIMDNLSNAKEEVFHRIQKITHSEETAEGKVGAALDRLRFFKVDMCDAEALQKLFKDHHFDSVIHYAGLKAVGESVENPLEYYSTNVGGTLNLLKVMDTAGCRRLVFSSSATVYRPKAGPIVETDPTGASNPYGQTKAMIEQILKDLHNADARWSIAVLRYFNPVGGHPSGLLGESPTHPNNLLPYIQQVAIGHRPHLYVFGTDWDTPDGTGVRDYLHVDDLAEGHIAALRKLEHEKDGCFLIHNLGTGKGHSVLEMADLFERVSGRKIPRKPAPRRPGDLSSVVADPSLAEQELGWKAQRSMEEAMASAWKWQSQNPNGYDTQAM